MSRPSMENMNQVIPLEYARYVLLNPEKDLEWREHARKLIEWVKTTPKWPKYIVHGATVTTEQGDGKSFCCSVLRTNAATATPRASPPSRHSIMRAPATWHTRRKRSDRSTG